jgi:hypothetical protein
MSAGDDDDDDDDDDDVEGIAVVDVADGGVEGFLFFVCFFEVDCVAVFGLVLGLLSLVLSASSLLLVLVVLVVLVLVLVLVVFLFCVV